MYQIAITSSLVEHGVSAPLKAASEQTVPHLIFFDGELLREQFENCLREEERSLEQAGLRRVRSITILPLAEGQMCIRAGYPVFETDAL
jgi:hypothetical protein